MARLPRNVRTVDVLRAFATASARGQEWDKSTSGREAYVMRWAGRTVPIPGHTGAIPQGTLRSIIRQAGWTVDEFRYLAGYMNSGERRNWLPQNPQWQRPG